MITQQDTPISDSVTTMLVEQELDYLRLLGSSCTGRGRVVELGCFLGGSSVALLRGLDASGHAYEPLISYDAFEIPADVDDRFAAWLTQYGLRPGERFREAFEHAIEAWKDRVVVREGWIPEDMGCEEIESLYPEQEPIELLFVDIAKAWGVHLSVLRAFGAHLLEGSVLVHQDFFDIQTPWIPLHMWQLRDVLEPLDALLPSPTCSFRCVKPIGEMLDGLWSESVDAGVIEEAWEQIIDYWTGIIGPDAAEVFHGHAFRLAVMQGRYDDAVGHGRAYEAWSRSAHSDGCYFSSCWHDLLETAPNEMPKSLKEQRELRILAAESMARGRRVDRPRPGQRMTHCPEPARVVVWEGMMRRLADRRFDRIILYGAGQHTHWLADALDTTVFPHIDLILDDHPSSDQIGGIQVQTTDSYKPKPNERLLIIPSSDSYEAAMLSRLHARFAGYPFVEVARVYTHEDAAADTLVRWRYFVEPVPADKQCQVHTESHQVTEVRYESEHRVKLGLPAQRVWFDELWDRFRPPDWSRDHFGLHEIAFVWDFVEAIRPKNIVEIGTASGVSSAMLLHGLNKFCAASSTLHCFDIATHCYFDPSRALGAAIGQMAPGLIERAHTYARTDAADAASLFRHGTIDLLLIDGEHANPAPTVDLISLIYALRPNAWVILHDVELEHIDIDGEMGKKSGAGRLFHAWPYTKVQLAGETPADRNIGAIRVPSPSADAIPHLLDLLRAPWESESHGVRLARKAHDAQQILRDAR